MKEDVVLINLVLNGDKTAFDKLVHKYYRECFEITRMMVKDSDLAQDLIQKAFIQAYFCISNLKDKTLFKFWLLGIVKNLIKRWKKEQQQYVSLESYSEYLHDQDEDKDIQLVTEIVLSNINKLPDAYRDIVNLFYYEDMNIKQIADVSDLTIETVKVRLHRGRKILKEAFQEYSELNQYHQTLKNKYNMRKVRIVDIIAYGTNQENYLFEHYSILLQDEDNLTVFFIVIGRAEAQLMAMELKKMKSNRPMVFDLMANLMNENGVEMDSAYIHDIAGGIFISTLRLRNGKLLQELDARPSDAITFALMLEKPIYVSQKVLTQAGFPVPEKYKHSNSKEKGIEILTKEIDNRNKKFEGWQKTFLQQPKSKTAEEIQQGINKLIEFAYGNDQIENQES